MEIEQEGIIESVCFGLEERFDKLMCLTIRVRHSKYLSSGFQFINDDIKDFLVKYKLRDVNDIVGKKCMVVFRGCMTIKLYFKDENDIKRQKLEEQLKKLKSDLADLMINKTTLKMEIEELEAEIKDLST